MATMQLTIHEEKLSISHFTGKNGPITSYENTLFHPQQSDKTYRKGKITHEVTTMVVSAVYK